MTSHYAYEYVNREGVVWYVGAGRNRRATDFRGRSAEFQRVLEENGGPEAQAILYHYCESPEKALEMEQELIRKHRRVSEGGTLCNETLGGPGAGYGNINKRGRPDSEVTRSRKSAALIGNQNLLGHRHSEESKEKIRQASLRYHARRRGA